MTSNEGDRVHCNRCGHKTQHGLRRSYSRTQEDNVEDHGTFEVRETVEILECLGCEHIIVRVTLEHDCYGLWVQFYPPPISRQMPRWKNKLPLPIRNVLEEVYKALQAESPRLATMGARTIIDLVAVDKIGDVGNFQQKLRELEEKCYVSGKNCEFIAAALDAGNAAAHRGLALNDEEVNCLMDIVENLLEAVYVLGEAAAKLRKSTPQRQRKVRG